MICLLAWSWTHASELSLKFQALKSDALVGEVVELEVSLVNTGTVAVSGVFLLEETAFEVAVRNQNELKTYTVPGRLMPEADYKETKLSQAKAFQRLCA